MMGLEEESLLDGWIEEQQWVTWASQYFGVVVVLNPFHSYKCRMCGCVEWNECCSNQIFEHYEPETFPILGSWGSRILDDFACGIVWVECRQGKKWKLHSLCWRPFLPYGQHCGHAQNSRKYGADEARGRPKKSIRNLQKYKIHPPKQHCWPPKRNRSIFKVWPTEPWTLGPFLSLVSIG